MNTTTDSRNELFHTLSSLQQQVAAACKTAERADNKDVCNMLEQFLNQISDVQMFSAPTEIDGSPVTTDYVPLEAKDEKWLMMHDADNDRFILWHLRTGCVIRGNKDLTGAEQEAELRAMFAHDA